MKKVTKKRVVVLGVHLPEQQVVMEAALEGVSVTFASSPADAVRLCKTAEVLALHTNYENYVPHFLERGFDGAIIPLLGGNKKMMKINGFSVEAVCVRDIPKRVQEILAALKKGPRREMVA